MGPILLARLPEARCPWLVPSGPMRRTVLLALLVAGCSAPETSEPPESGAEAEAALPDILAQNAFLYYRDLAEAEAFYGELLGLPLVSDFGFAKIFQVAESAYLTIVDEAEGMHSADEPKTVAFALVTDRLADWQARLDAAGGVEFRSRFDPDSADPAAAHHGFTVFDPGGYILEFEVFLPHAENTDLMPILDETEPLGGDAAAAGAGMGFEAMIVWLYHPDIPAILDFYQTTFGFPQTVDQGWVKILRTSHAGFVGLVDSARGMHSFTEDKAVTVSFFTEAVEPWFEHLAGAPGYRARSTEIGMESGRVQTFVGYDPGNYTLEFDRFLDAPGNEELVAQLESVPRRP